VIEAGGFGDTPLGEGRVEPLRAQLLAYPSGCGPQVAASFVLDTA
jgi:hypothetical protein